MRGWTAVAALAGVTTIGCGGDNGPPPLREVSPSYAFEISADTLPPRAESDVHYTIRVWDRKTHDPIATGDGQLFAGKPIDDDIPTGPQSKTWDAMAASGEPGAYRAKLNFIIAGQWAVAIRFRRDSLHPLERIDWMQDVVRVPSTSGTQ
jgi:hypothetical protein